MSSCHLPFDRYYLNISGRFSSDLPNGREGDVSTATSNTDAGDDATPDEREIRIPAISSLRRGSSMNHVVLVVNSLIVRPYWPE
jgi:hypothetical protein